MAISHVKSNTVGDFTGTVTVFDSLGSTQTANATNLVRPSDWNSAHNQYYTLTGNTNNASTVSGTDIVFSGGSNVTLIGSGSQIGISAFGGVTLSAFANELYMPNSQTIQPRQSTSVVFPIAMNDAVSFDHIRFPLTVSLGSTTLATTGNTTFSNGVSYTFNVAFYETNIGNATSLVSRLTTSAGVSQSINVQVNSNSTQYSVSIGFTYPQNGTGTNITNTFSSSYNVSTSNIAISTTGLTAFSGMKHFEIPLQSSLAPDMYWVVLGVSSNTAAQVAGASAGNLIHSFWGMSQPNNTWGFFGQANNASVQNITGVGSFSTAGGGTVAGLGFSNISSSASHVVPYIYMEYDG